jgi:serine/threonine-protein kinase ULK/ATG1
MEIVGDFEYNPKELIGHGAFAVVFRGRHKKVIEVDIRFSSFFLDNLMRKREMRKN